MESTASAFFMAGLGLAVLAAGRLTPGPDAMVAVIVPPWPNAVISMVLAAHVPLVDVRAGGHLLVVSADADARKRLRDRGAWLIAATPAGLCIEDFSGAGVSPKGASGEKT